MLKIKHANAYARHFLELARVEKAACVGVVLPEQLLEYGQPVARRVLGYRPREELVDAPARLVNKRAIDM